MIHRDLRENVVPRMGVVGKSQHHLEDLQSVLVGRSQPLMDARSEQYLVEEIEGRRAEEPVLLSAQHADGSEESCHEPAAKHAAMPERLAVEIGRAGEWKDRAQMRRPLQRRAILLDGEVAHADHADLAVAPRLRGHPFDQVIEVGLLRRPPEVVGAFAAAGAAAVGNHVRIAAGDEKIALPCFHEAGGNPQTLHLARIGRHRDQRREASVGVGAIDVRAQTEAFSHRNRNAVFGRDGKLRFGQVAILPPRRLYAGELPLPRLHAGALHGWGHVAAQINLARMPYHWNCS
jgi:hypothetical protein